MLWAPIPDRSKPLLGSTVFILCCRWQPSSLWCSTHWAPENSVLAIECHLYCDRMFPHTSWWDCTGTALRFHVCWNSGIAVVKGGEQEKRFIGMKNPLDDFGPQKEMQHLAQKVLLECLKTKGRRRRIKDSAGLRAEYRGGWMLPPASVTVAVAAPPSPQFIPEGLMRGVRNLSWKDRFPLFHISFCLPSHRLESSGLYSLFLN